MFFVLEKIDKAGATVLFEDPQSKGNNVGVVVNPVRISSLNEFGTVDVVADKLLQAERRKVMDLFFTAILGILGVGFFLSKFLRVCCSLALMMCSSLR